MTDIYLEEALSAAQLAVLPDPLGEWSRKIWVKAIVRVEKMGAHTGYCIADNAGDGKIEYKRIFGPSGVITKVVSVHPYIFLDKKYQPVLRSDKDYRTYLVKGKVEASLVDSLLEMDGKSPEECKADRAKIKALVEAVAIREASMHIAEEERCQKIMEYGKATD